MNVTASAIDLFVQLDRLVEVYGRLAKLLTLPPSTHQQVVQISPRMPYHLIQLYTHSTRPALSK